MAKKLNPTKLLEYVRRSKLIGESAPAFVEELKADNVDLLIAIPA